MKLITEMRNTPIATTNPISTTGTQSYERGTVISQKQ
jgi:hypothetical protein